MISIFVWSLISSNYWSSARENSFLVMCNSCDWKNWVVILIPAIYLVGVVIIEIPIFLKLLGYVKKFTFTVGTFFNFLFVFPDYGVML